MGRILCVETQGYHRDIGTPESLHQARSRLEPKAAASATRRQRTATRIAR